MRPETELAIRQFLQTTLASEEEQDITVKAAKHADKQLRQRLPGVEFRESIEVCENWPYRKLHYQMKGLGHHTRRYGSIIWSGR